MDLDEVADELYAVPPDEFVAVRRQRQDDARAAGDRTLARGIGALPKPTTAAWVCNLLVREQRAQIEGLVELGGLLREAQENLDGEELRALDVQRRRLIAALARQRRALAHAHGWYGFMLRPEQAAARVRALREAAESVERPPHLGPLEITVTPRGRLDRDRLEEFRAAGVHRLVLSPRTGLERAALEDYVREHAELIAPTRP